MRLFCQLSYPLDCSKLFEFNTSKYIFLNWNYFLKNDKGRKKVSAIIHMLSMECLISELLKKIIQIVFIVSSVLDKEKIKKKLVRSIAIAIFILYLMNFVKKISTKTIYTKLPYYDEKKKQTKNNQCVALIEQRNWDKKKYRSQPILN